MTGRLVDGDLTRAVIGAFYEVYNGLGFGLLECLYNSAMEVELRAHGIRVAREVAVGVEYKKIKIGFQRLDMLVEERVVVEAKATLDLHPSAHRQVYSYLRAARLEVGLLLHFGLEPKFHRIFNHVRARD